MAEISRGKVARRWACPTRRLEESQASGCSMRDRVSWALNSARRVASSCGSSVIWQETTFYFAVAGRATRQHSPASPARQGCGLLLVAWCGKQLTMRWTFLTTPVLVVALVCPSALFAGPSTDTVAAPVFQEWQIWEVKTGRALSFEQLIGALEQLDVVYFGEEHHNQWHVEAARKILQTLLLQGLHPILALEMFGWDGQAAVDRYLADKEWGRDSFLKESHWEQSWGGAFGDYEPLVALARAQGLPVLALNPPKQLVRLVAKQGLAQALVDPEMERWGMKGEVLVDEPAYHDMIVKPLRQCHGGLSDHAYQRMYEASMFRDEGMAKTIAEALRRRSPGTTPDARTPNGPIISYTGGGHIQYRLPVPNRVLRRRKGAVKQATIYLTSFEPSRAEELRSLMQEDVADYLWLTPIGAQGAPKRCR